MKQLLINKLLSLNGLSTSPHTHHYAVPSVGCGFVLLLFLLVSTTNLKSQNCFDNSHLTFADYNCVSPANYTIRLDVMAEAPVQPSTYSIHGSINLSGLEYGKAYEFSFIGIQYESHYFQLQDELNQCDTTFVMGYYDYPNWPYWKISNIELEKCRIENDEIKQLAKIHLEHDFPIERLCDDKNFWISYYDETNTYQYEELGYYAVDTSYLEIEILGYKQIQLINSISLPDYDLACNLSDVHNTDVFVFPTVVQNELFIHLSHSLTVEKAKIFGLNGQFIGNFALNDSSIEVSSLQKGLYVLQLTVNNQIYPFKFLKT